MTAKAQDDPTTAYVTHCPECNGLCAAAVFEPKESRKGSLALFLAGEALEGAAIDRVPCEKVRESFGHGDGCSRPRARDGDETVLSIDIHDDGRGTDSVDLSDFRDDGKLDSWELKQVLGDDVFEWLNAAEPGAVLILHAKGKP